MAELKTKPTKESAHAFIKSLADEQRRKECRALLSMMREITGKKPVMWGNAIVGFGNYHYKYRSGREGDWFLTGFSPRKTALTVYIMPGFSRYESLLEELGKHKRSVSCLYIKRLEQIDLSVLRTLVERAVADLHEMYDCR